MVYRSSVKLLGIFDIDVEVFNIRIDSKNPEQFNSELLKNVRPIFRPFCVVKWKKLLTK